MEKLTDKQIENIFELYFEANKLKNLLRTGWLYMQVENTRKESVAEHITGACLLALAIYDNSKIKIDIQKVVMMLVLHEMEEIVIGDITPHDTEKNKTKKQDGKRAVDFLFRNCQRNTCKEIIAEFEEKKTPEAIFAHQIDKFEADIQSFIYEPNFCYEKIEDRFLNTEQGKKLTAQGYTKISQRFLQNDKPIFSNEFLDLANFLEQKEK